MFRFTPALLLLVAMPLAAHATPMTYSFNNTFSGFSMTGSVTTDGVMGALKTADITSYSFQLTEGSTTMTLNSSNSKQNVYGGLSADAAGLYFAFGGSGGWLVQNPFVGAGSNFLCFQSANFFCYIPNGTASIAINIGGLSGIADAYQTMSGKQQIGTALSPTPEPSSLVLLGTGALGLAGVVRRRLRRA